LALSGFREGDRVKAAILNIEKKKISLSLKPSHFVEGDFDVNDDNESDAHASESEALGVMDIDEGISEHDDGAEDVVVQAGSDSEDDEVMQVDLSATRCSESSHSHKPTTANASIPSLKLSGGFHWSNNDSQQDEEAGFTSDSDGESDTGGQPSKKKRRRRKEIEQDHTADMHTKTPESNADFERVLLGSPNSSYLWIQYMSFQLQLSEVEKARDIARRAIRTINFREEQERLNVWIALLNLENVYGTEETVDTLFKEATRANDSKTVHLRLASIFNETEKHEVCVSSVHD
jgi:rRNA biogenesis protein RRP5